MNSNEEKVQRAVGTLPKIEVTFNATTTIQFEISLIEITEAVSDEEAVTKVRNYLRTPKGKREAIRRGLQYLMDNCAADTGEIMLDDLIKADNSRAWEINFKPIEVCEAFDNDDITVK